MKSSTERVQTQAGGQGASTCLDNGRKRKAFIRMINLMWPNALAETPDLTNQRVLMSGEEFMFRVNLDFLIFEQGL